MLTAINTVSYSHQSESQELISLNAILFCLQPYTEQNHPIYYLYITSDKSKSIGKQLLLCFPFFMTLVRSCSEESWHVCAY